MNSLIRILQVSTVLACALALFSVQGNAVTRVKSGSNYGGTDTNSNGVTDCAQMLTPPYPEGCQAYALLTNSAPITINGSITDVTEYAFSDGSLSDFGDIFDVYDLGIGNYTDVNVSRLVGRLWAYSLAKRYAIGFQHSILRLIQHQPSEFWRALHPDPGLRDQRQPDN